MVTGAFVVASAAAGAAFVSSARAEIVASAAVAIKAMVKRIRFIILIGIVFKWIVT
jgi:hypothetical protein